MTATDPYALAQVNPVGALIAWYRQSTIIYTEFGDNTHISGRNKDPYPQIRVAPSAGGDDRDMTWATDPEVLIEVYGNIDGTPGQTALRRLALIAFGVALQAADRDDYTETDPVISSVRSTSPARYATDPATGQPRWAKTMILTMHPPQTLT